MRWQPATTVRKRKPSVANIGNPTRHTKLGRMIGYKGNGNWVSMQAESFMFPSLNHHARLIPIERKKR
jgi:hypothetical protein